MLSTKHLEHKTRNCILFWSEISGIYITQEICVRINLIGAILSAASPETLMMREFLATQTIWISYKPNMSRCWKTISFFFPMAKCGTRKTQHLKMLAINFQICAKFFIRFNYRSEFMFVFLKCQTIFFSPQEIIRILMRDHTSVRSLNCDRIICNSHVVIHPKPILSV